MMTTEVRRPLILLTCDHETVGRTASEAHSTVRANYAEAIVEAGGSALIVPCERAQLSSVLAMADGVVVTGGPAGIDVHERRVAFERELIERTLTASKPLLGICHGMQLIGEHLGGRIVKDRPGMYGDTTLHLPHPIPNQLAHEIEIDPTSKLARWNGATTARVNSFHRHLLVGPGRFRVSARAPDGEIEAIEGTDDGFCVGVQWHPEYRLGPLDRALMAAFVEQCRQPRERRRSGE